MSNTLYIWTVYGKPKDYPNHYVARRWLVNIDGPVQTDTLLLCDTLEDIRAEMLKRHLHLLPRMPGDDPVIVESWI